MKTLITTFAIAVMVFALNTPSPAFATEESDRKTKDFFFPPSVGTGCVDPNTGSIMEGTTNCEQYHSSIDDLKDPDQVDNERDIADSGNEGSTSATSASDQ